MIKDITIFTRTTCAPCHAVKKFLRNKNVAFNEVNVDENPEAQKEAMAITGYSIVPLTIITKIDGSKNVITGMNFSDLAAAI